MRLRPAVIPDFTWPTRAIASWEMLTDSARTAKGGAGQGDAFELTKQKLLTAADHREAKARIAALLGKRVTARALTALWVEDETFRSKTLTPDLLDKLVASQRSELTRLTLSNLCALFLGCFDQLGTRLLPLLGHLINQQCQRFLVMRNEDLTDIWQVGKEHPWMFTPEGPSTFVDRVRQHGQELETSFRRYGLTGYDGGRFGDLCRATYYLEELRQLPVADWHPVMDELLKESVHRAPYKDGKLIGHAALEIIIDRVAGDPSDAWQHFVLEIAGDPRIASSSAAYRTWWQMLGQERINKVRGWLSKLDLRLFLSAVEEYGKHSRNLELQRMFPARKKFLEGLLDLGLIKSTRLMLGGSAAANIRHLLDGNTSVSYAELIGANMTNKAVLYIDCTSFHLIEGSHSFKLWMYLAQPSSELLSYDKRYFTHSELTTKAEQAYKKRHPKLRHTDITHNGWWQKKAFEFLADNGIDINIEKLLSQQDYKLYLQRFGRPVASPHPWRV